MSDDDRVWRWVIGADGKRRLVRVGSLRRLFRVSWSTVLVVLVVVFCFLYVRTAMVECSALLESPELYCPCLDDSPLLAPNWSGVDLSLPPAGVG